MEKASKAQLKKARELMRDRQARDAGGLFVAEGLKIVRDMISKGHVPDPMIVSRDFAEKEENKIFLRDAHGRSFPVFETANADFEKISSLRHSQGIMAVIKKPERSGDIPVGEKGAILVLCDGIQDPGNLGAMIRISVAFGAGSMLLAGETVDIYNPKVIRASSGMMLDIPVYVCDAAELDRLRKQGYRLLVSQPPEQESEDITDMTEFPPPVIIAFGSEGKGVSEEISNKADRFFHVPIRKGVESLNVTAAAAISLYVFTKSYVAGA